MKFVTWTSVVFFPVWHTTEYIESFVACFVERKELLLRGKVRFIDGGLVWLVSAIAKYWHAKNGFHETWLCAFRLKFKHGSCFEDRRVRMDALNADLKHSTLLYHGFNFVSWNKRQTNTCMLELKMANGFSLSVFQFLQRAILHIFSSCLFYFRLQL